MVISFARVTLCVKLPLDPQRSFKPLTMAYRSSLPSDLDVLLEYLHDLPDESDSEDEFDGYLGPEDGPVACLTSFKQHGDEGLTCRSASLDDLTALQSESPLAGLSPPLSCGRTVREWLSSCTN